jgi:hypothetical protein
MTLFIPFLRRIKQLQTAAVSLPYIYLRQKCLDIHLKSLKDRYQVFDWLGNAPPYIPRPIRVLAIITHHTGGPYASKHQVSKPEKLRATIEALTTSLSHIQHLEVIVNTTSQDNVVDALPDWARNKIRVHSSQLEDPMYLGFRAQPLMFDNIDRFDYYIYLEDDIAIEDPLFLDKKAWFDHEVNSVNVLLMPHRYEVYQGNKNYTDLYSWSDIAAIQLGRWEFRQCANPNSGMWCLNNRQLRYFMEHGRKTYDFVSMFGPVESAGFGNLLECFQVYKPFHPNLHFLEVRHWDVRFYQEFQSWLVATGASVHSPLKPSQS